MEKTVLFGKTPIGEDHRVFVVAELGVTHEQNPDLAISFVRQAAAAGFDSVKVESFQADELVADKSVNHTYGTAAGMVTENYYDLLKRLELSYEDFARIKEAADNESVGFFPTVATQASVVFFEQLNCTAYKLASPDIVNTPLQEIVAATGKPIFMDTGGAYLHEIEKALLNLERFGARQVVLMHNPSGYPAPPEKTDLRMIPMLKKLFGIPVGLSCHTPGADCIMAAIALGCDIIEKPITRDNSISSPEHIFSLPVDQCHELITRIRNLEKSMGGYRRTQIENNSLPRDIGRRGVYAATDLKSGQALEFSDIILAKPQKGISVDHLDIMLGRTLLKDVPRLAPITWEDL